MNRADSRRFRGGAGLVPGVRGSGVNTERRAVRAPVFEAALEIRGTAILANRLRQRRAKWAKSASPAGSRRLEHFSKLEHSERRCGGNRRSAILLPMF